MSKTIYSISFFLLIGVAVLCTQDNFMTIAHRGASAYEPENTMAAFQKAVELGAGMIEFDVRKCKSGELVVMHDKTVDRTTSGSGLVSDLSYDYLKTLDAGNGQKVPHLSEILDVFSKKIKINIELKDRTCEKEVLQLVCSYIKKGLWSYDDIIVSSFDHHQLKRIKMINPCIKIGTLIEHSPLDYAASAKKLKAYSVNMNHEQIDAGLIADAKKKNLKVFVYTVNDFSEMQALIAMGVDGIISNKPDLVAQAAQTK